MSWEASSNRSAKSTSLPETLRPTDIFVAPAARRRIAAHAAAGCDSD
ncbi:hypothetical protein BURPS668_1802 [Burkholderia pseudomallei 668]|nr:hypothetical protein BURPS668_1802 [Burkholderia pseudomallei 668]